jgi:predicted ribosomally synthesized peptide with nif11-like leader
MSAEHAKAWYELVAGDESVREELKTVWQNIEALAKKHGLEFTQAELYDFIHEHTGMTNAGKSDSRATTDIITITV